MEATRVKIVSMEGGLGTSTVSRLTEPKDIEHAHLSWTACYDYCPIHLSEKEGSNWFPKRPRKSKW